MEEIFLTLEELQKLRPLSPNLNLEKINNWIFEAQIDEMRNFLGGELYKLMAEDWDGTNFLEPRFVSLWEGDESGEEIYFGLWRAIGFFSISNIIKNNSFNVTRYSNSEMDSDIEEQARETAATSSASVSYSQGIKMMNEAQDYLEENASDYPEYQVNLEEKPSTFEYLRVPPNRKNLKNGF